MLISFEKLIFGSAKKLKIVFKMSFVYFVYNANKNETFAYKSLLLHESNLI